MAAMDSVVTREQLDGILENKQTWKFEYGNGAYVEILKEGARVIGMIHSNDPNELNGLAVFPKTRDMIENPEQGKGQQILPGGRGWLGNEMKYHLKLVGRWDTWYNPHGMDPGRFSLDEDGEDFVALISNGSVKAARRPGQFDRDRKTFNFEMKRKFSRLENPYKGSTPSGVTYTGVHIDYGVQVKGEENPKMNLWHLFPLFSCTEDRPGSLIIPTNTKTRPVPYMEKGERTLKDRIRIASDAIYFKHSNEGPFKTGAEAEDIRYMLENNDEYAISMRISPVPDESGKYELSVTRVLREYMPQSRAEIHDAPKMNPKSKARAAIPSYSGPAPRNPDVVFAEQEVSLSELVRNNDGYGRMGGLDFIQYRGNFGDILKMAEDISHIRQMEKYLFKGKG